MLPHRLELAQTLGLLGQLGQTRVL